MGCPGGCGARPAMGNFSPVFTYFSLTEPSPLPANVTAVVPLRIVQIHGVVVRPELHSVIWVDTPVANSLLRSGYARTI